MRRLFLLASVLLAGASGLGLEVLFLSSAGLVLGYGRSTAVGLSVFIAGWAIGAYAGGRWRGTSARALLVLGAALALLANPALRVVLDFGSEASGSRGGEIAAVLLIALVAALQGAYLPLLARAEAEVDARPRDVSLLLACSFAGSLLGAYAIGDRAVAEIGRSGAAFVAGGVALAAGLLGALATRGNEARELETQARGARGIGARADGARGSEPRGRDAADEPDDSLPAERVAVPKPSISFARAAWIVGWTTAWLAGLEWIGLRLGVLWLSGMQPALTAVLCASLLALALGAFVLPRLFRNSFGGVFAVLCLCALGAAWPVHAALALRALGTAARSAQEISDGDPLRWQTALERVPEIVRALVLVGPSLAALGAVVPMLHRLLPRSSGARGRRLGRLYLHEAWGALLGVPIVHFVLVPRLGLAGATAAMMGAGFLVFLATWPSSARASLLGMLAVAALATWTARQPDPALDSPPLANPAFTLRSFRHDRDFAVAVVDDGRAGERTLLTDGFRAAGTGAEYKYMSVLGHLPVLLHERPRRVAVLALGTGTTLGAVALHPEVERIDVLEISPAVVDAAPWFEAKNHGVLESAPRDPGDGPEDTGGAERVRVRLGDGRFTLARHPGQYDVITMEPLLPDSPFAVYLYTREFYERVRRALAPGGLVCQWVPPHALEPASFAAVLGAFESSFRWSSVWLFGTQVILLGGERAPALDARRFPPTSTELGAALRDLGIGSADGLLARWVSGAAADAIVDPPTEPESHASLAASTESRAKPASTRALTDVDPWIAYRPRRSGPVLLGDLPDNLRWLRAHAGEPPESWLRAAGPAARRRWEGVRALHAAREAHAREEARMRGAPMTAGTTGTTGATITMNATNANDLELARALETAHAQCAGDPELVDLEREIAFLSALRRGVASLSADRTRAGAEAALPDLLRAAELERERADVHLYTATALSRMGSPAAPKALEAALTRCPRAAETPEGRRARELGLAPDLWRRAEEAALAAHRSID